MEDNLTMPQVLRREEAQNLVREVGGLMFLLAAKRQSIPLALQGLVSDLAAELLRAVAGRQTAESAFAALERENLQIIADNHRLRAELDGLRAEHEQYREFVASCAALRGGEAQAVAGQVAQLPNGGGAPTPSGGLDDIDF